MKVDSLILYVVDSAIHVVTNEWDVPCDQSVVNDSHTPDVYCSVVGLS